MTQKQKRHSIHHPGMLYVSSFSELWERFSFYIVEALLVVYLIESKHLSQTYSYQLLGTYIANSFVLTLVGAYFGQNIIGFRSGVNLGAVLMSVGYALLLDPDLEDLHRALALIVVGSAFFKPNMACFVGELYQAKNTPRYNAAYSIYYASIMIGVLLSTSISGYVLDLYGWNVTFMLASISMAFAFVVFWVGNVFIHNHDYSKVHLLTSPYLRWSLTCAVCFFLWIFMQIALDNPSVAHGEMVVCVLALFGYFFKELLSLSKPFRIRFYACVVLLFLSCIYWALLFQLFFSFNVMIKYIVNRQFFQFELPSPLFMGVESFFVILFSPLLGKLWIEMNQKGRTISLFLKYFLAFLSCSIGLFLLFVSLKISPMPHFLWILCAYLFIGLGEAILAPTALAMIGQLSQDAHIGVMMASLYVFWGLGTKLADFLAQWSVFPATLKEAASIAPYFEHAVAGYFCIAFAAAGLSYLGHKVYTRHS